MNIMTKKKELEEDVLKQKAIEEEIKEEVGEAEKEEMKPEVTEKENKVEEQEEKINEKAELKKKAEEYLNSWKRCQADFENYKKDQAKRMEEFRKFASLDMVLQILPVLDNFEMSLSHVPEDKKDGAWVQGILHIKKQLEQVLKDNSIEEIEVKEGDEFNPHIHEAITNDQEAITKEKKNVIKQVAQKGYKIDGKVIRAARVIVA